MPVSYDVKSDDPHGIIGKEVKAADGGNYGHRVISYDKEREEYEVKAIRWSDGELLPDTVAPRTIDVHKITWRYDITSARSWKELARG